jgi:hypothetical protein
VDALDQRSALVETRPSGGERCVEVEVAVDERRRHEAAGRVDHRLGVSSFADPRPAAALGDEIEDATVHQSRVADDEVGHALESTVAIASISTSWSG